MASLTSRKLPEPFFTFKLAILFFLAIFIPRILAIGRFVTVDEPTWGKRSANFYYSLMNGKYDYTYQSGHPGVIVLWAGAGGFQLEFNQYQRVGQSEIGDTKLFLLFKRHGGNPLEVLVTARTILVVLISLSLVGAYFYARLLFDNDIAALAILLIAFDPFYVAHSRLLHTFAILSSFMLLSLLAYLHYLREGKRLSLAVSAVTAGLSFLTVTPGILLLPAFLVISLINGLRLPGKSARLRTRSWLKQSLFSLLIWGLLAGLIVFSLWPAMWSDPVSTISKVIDHTLNATEGEIGGAEFLVSYNQGYDTQFKYPYFYPYMFLWRTTPLILMGLLFTIISFKSTHTRLAKPFIRRTLADLLIFILVYLFMMSIGSKKYDRYLLPAYLPLMLIAAAGWLAAGDWLAARFSGLQKIRLAVWIIPVIAAGQLAFTLAHYPYYFSYYNPLMGGAQKASDVMLIGLGEGLSEAAQYLDRLPSEERERIISWYPLAFNWYSFSLGFEAEPIEIARQIDPPTLENFLSADYAVVYANQWQRNMPPELLSALAPLKPEQVIRFKGLEYVRIYRLPSRVTDE